MQIIPALDIIDGKCVRLTHGDYSQKTVYDYSPLEIAKQFEDAGLSRLHMVDLDGAKRGAVKNWKVLEAVAGKTNLIIDFGGGIKSNKDLEIVFSSGASMVSVGSVAVKQPDLLNAWITSYSPQKFLLGADVKDKKIMIDAWATQTKIAIDLFISGFLEKGISQIFCTDISKDGALQGPAVELYKDLIEEFPDCFLIASGGVSSLSDLEKLRDVGCKGAIVGKAIYEGRISLQELSKFNA